MGIFKGQISLSGALNNQTSSSGALKGQTSSSGALKGQTSSSGALKGQTSSSGALKGQTSSSGALKGKTTRQMPLVGHPTNAHVDFVARHQKYANLSKMTRNNNKKCFFFRILGMLRILKYKPPMEISQNFRQGLVEGQKQVEN